VKSGNYEAPHYVIFFLLLLMYEYSEQHVLLKHHHINLRSYLRAADQVSRLYINLWWRFVVYFNI